MLEVLEAGGDGHKRRERRRQPKWADWGWTALFASVDAAGKSGKDGDVLCLERQQLRLTAMSRLSGRYGRAEVGSKAVER